MTHPKSWYQTFWTGQGIGALKDYQADEEPYQESQCQRGKVLEVPKGPQELWNATS